MEKLTFIMRCLIIMAAFPVIMYADLTRDENKTVEQKQNEAGKVMSKGNDSSVQSLASYASGI